MAITLTSTPERTDFGVTSRFLAVGNPLPFKFQFDTFDTFTALSFGVLNNRVFALVSVLPTTVQVSDFVKLEKLSDGSDVFTTVTAIDTVNLRIFFNLSVNEGYSTVINNWIPNDYYLQINLEVEGERIDLTKVSPFSNGSLFFDPSQYLENELLNIDSFDYVTAQVKDNDASKEFKLIYQEYFRGQLQGTEEETETFFAVNAAKQVQEVYGANLLDKLFLPTQTKILSAFNEPKVWAGYPFSLDILAGEGLSSNEITTPSGTVTLDQGLFNSVNRIAFDVSSLNTSDGCIESGTTTPPVNSFIWVNEVCEVIPTVTTPPPDVQPIPEPETPEFCGDNINFGGGAGIADKAYSINYAGYFSLLFDPYTETDKAELGLLQADNLTVNILATTDFTSTDFTTPIDTNTGLGVGGGNIDLIAFDANGERLLSEDAVGSGTNLGADAVSQFIGQAKGLYPAGNRLAEYEALTGDLNAPKRFGSVNDRLQYVTIPVSPGDIVVSRFSGKGGTAYSGVVFCYQTS